MPPKRSLITDKIDSITHIPPEYLRPDPPCPRSVKIELTGRCNYRCGFCALRVREVQPRGDMDFEFFKKITKDMHESGVEEIGLFYLGESLMTPHLTVRACQYLKDMGVPYVLRTTNGSLATESVVRRLMDAGLDSLKFSINASDPDQFSEVMGVKSKYFDQSLNNLKRAWEIRSGHTKLYASSIQYDGEQAERMRTLVWERIEPYVDQHYWLPLYSMGSVATERERELGYRPTAGNQGRIGGLVNPLPCWSLMTEGHVRSDGQVSLCCFDADGRFQVGDLTKDSWMDIWHNDDFQRVREAHLAKDLTGTVCEECVAY